MSATVSSAKAAAMGFLSSSCILITLGFYALRQLEKSDGGYISDEPGDLEDRNRIDRGAGAAFDEQRRDY